MEETAILDCRACMRTETWGDSVRAGSLGHCTASRLQQHPGVVRRFGEPLQGTQTLFLQHAGGISTVMLGTPISHGVSDHR